MCHSGVLLLIIVIIWCWGTGRFSDWRESTQHAYEELAGSLGPPKQCSSERDGGAVWWQPNQLEILNTVCLHDHDPPLLQANLQVKLYAGYECLPNDAAVTEMIERVSKLPGVYYSSSGRQFHLSAQNAEELLRRTYTVARVTRGCDPEQDFKQDSESRTVPSLRNKLSKYSQYLKPGKSN